ncbi:type IV secretory system conjugative DNA transfer family protein [Kordiimonas pumila]|uniref:Type IV secretory system conjugative DNA transfer family protein n=1 Tax=Kordiimonas pumila TaxID=2161677 RepID=A0ABV7D539_9PROT|nr:type IV secretory system conjugative DNA transfer family protein [Kordiimonas pumila]
MTDFDNERDRYGSAGFIDADDPALRPCFKKTPDSLFCGFVGNRPLYWNGMGGVLLTAGARGGKLRDILAYSMLDGMYEGTLVMLDMKGECAYISQNQTRLGKPCIYWNPLALHGGSLPQHRINPVDYIHADSPTLIADTKVFAENMIALSGSNNGEYFELRGREFLEAVILTIVDMDGALTLPRLYEIINLIPGNSEAWVEFAFQMNECGFEISRRIEEEIAESRHGESAGMRGILGEIFKSFSALSDPVLLDSISPPYDFSLSQLCEGSQAYNFYMMPPAEFIDGWRSVIKAIFVGAMIYKSRAPSAPRQTWILDECAQLGSFPLVPKLFTYTAGIGIRPVAVYQSADQMELTGRGAKTIIPSSAAVRIYFTIRDEEGSARLSRMLGHQTLEYDDTLTQGRDDMARKEAIHAMLNGASPVETAHKLNHYRMAAKNRSKQQRLLRTPDEILKTPNDKAYVFMDDVPLPIYADRRPYYKERSMAGRFHPNPYHPPIDRVRVKALIGYRWKNIINEPVPACFAHLPQYADGMWSYVEGFK